MKQLLFSDIMNTGRLEDKVYGVLFKVQSDDLGKLDKFEGRGYGYERASVKVTSESGETFSAETYVATDVNADIRPYLWYKEHVLRGQKHQTYQKHIYIYDQCS